MSNSSKHIQKNSIVAAWNCTGRAGMYALLGLIASSAAVFAAAPAGAATIAIGNVRIIDGNGGPPIEHGRIILQDRRILAVGASSDIKVPAGAQRIDGKGGSVFPGLADMHVHLHEPCTTVKIPDVSRGCSLTSTGPSRLDPLSCAVRTTGDIELINDARIITGVCASGVE